MCSKEAVYDLAFEENIETDTLLRSFLFKELKKISRKRRADAFDVEVRIIFLDILRCFRDYSLTIPMKHF
jgi:hypothetical protein